MGDSSPKGELIPHVLRSDSEKSRGNLAFLEELAAYQLVGEVTAYQGSDG
jgi:hypothetical protein